MARASPLASFLVVAACLVTFAGPKASPFGTVLPSGLSLSRIQLGQLTLAPLGYTVFCLRYPGECMHPKQVVDGSFPRLSESAWTTLRNVNTSVNSSIVPWQTQADIADDMWLIEPQTGDCNDYAVTKRHRLLMQGWPPHSLLLAEVATASDQHHLVIIVRTDVGDLVLDNLTDQIMPWTLTLYRWIRIQLPTDSALWATMHGGRGRL